MKRSGICFFAALVFCMGSLSAEEKPKDQPLSNADVIEMSRAGVPQSTIINAIQTTPVKFDVSPAGLIALHAGGVTEAVLNQMVRASTRSKTDASFGVATATFPVKDLKDATGKTVHYSAWIKTDNVLNGYAGIWWRVDGQEKGKVLSFDNSQARFIGDTPAADNGVIRAATGTTDWTQYQFDLPIPEGARNINFGLLFTGTGTAWFDSLKIDLDGAPYNPQAFDLDFESTLAKGFYTGGDGYKVRIDNTTAYTGSQSLKMTYVGDSGGSQPSAAKSSAASSATTHQ